MKIRDYIYEFETVAGGEPAAAGTGEPPAEPTTPPAGESNADNGGGPPETIPYSRFKEVNDQLRPFKELERVGYGAAELQRLAEWEQAYAENPEQVWLNHASQLDLPQELKDSIAAHLTGGTEPSTPATAQPPEAPPASDDSEPPEWAKPLVADYHERQTAEAQRASQQVLDGILASWDAKDAENNFTVPDQMKDEYQQLRLSLIAGNARGAQTPEEIFNASYRLAHGFRDAVLQASVVRPGERGPLSVPAGDGAQLPAEPPTTPKTMEEAALVAKQYFRDNPGEQ